MVYCAWIFVKQKTTDEMRISDWSSDVCSSDLWPDNHLGDRDDIVMVGQQQELFDALKALGKPIVVVLTNGRPLAVNTVAEQANALIEGWYGGEQGGTAMADVLFGSVNPGGKLPVTIARSVGDRKSTRLNSSH